MFVFFFQAEDGIRDYKVTGVQTCALPIWQRIHLVETFTYEFRQPYHSAEKMLRRPAREFISRMRAEARRLARRAIRDVDRKSTRLNSSHLVISYAVFCLKKKNKA